MQGCISKESSPRVLSLHPIMTALDISTYSQYVVSGLRYDHLHDWSERQAKLGETALSWWEIKPGRSLSLVVMILRR